MDDGNRREPPTADPPLVAGTVARLLATRRMAGALAGVGLAQVGLTLAHVGGMPCPFLAVTGRPCPGCGLSRAAAALCRGDFGTAVQLHAFAPIVLLAIAVLGAATVLPVAGRRFLVNAVDHAERRWWATRLLLALLLLYWTLRLGYAPAQVARIASAGF